MLTSLLLGLAAMGAQAGLHGFIMPPKAVARVQSARFNCLRFSRKTSPAPSILRDKFPMRVMTSVATA